MSPTAFDARIRKVISSVFGIREAQITETTGPDTVPSWDSLHHIHFVVALEAEFAVSFEPDQALALTSMTAIRDALVALGAR
jgi:acyl carrier protein